MTSEEMKLIKFESIIKEIWEQLIYFAVMGDYKKDENNALKLLLGENSNNNYGEIVLNSFVNRRRYFVICNYNWKESDLKELICKCKKCKYGIGKHATCYIPTDLMFFSLLFIAVDNDSYNEKINIISDFAYLMGFNIEMINDWIYVAKAILEDEKVDFGRIKTDTCKEFVCILPEKWRA